MASEDSDIPAVKLCVFCRDLEATSQPCPTLLKFPGYSGRPTSNCHHVPLKRPSTVSSFSSRDKTLIEELQKQPSRECKRCKEYDIVAVFRDADPPDSRELHAMSDDNGTPINKDGRLEFEERYEINLGHLPSLILDPACPLCRLIYRIIPREGLDPRDDTLKLTPYRSYKRASATDRLSSESKSQTAIMLGLSNSESILPPLIPLVAGSRRIDMAEMTGEAICLASAHTFPGRQKDNGRFVESMVDFEMVKTALDLCLDRCGGICSTHQPPELRMTRMVDVMIRETVPCPENCDYLALSYVWGGVMPVDGALKAGTLPQTIEDSITITKKLGRRYLWVDALCIDQTPNPTPEQAEAKAAQLKMMHLIYGCATLTILAVSGVTADSGIPGVREEHPRQGQVKEIIGGREFFTIPPTSNILPNMQTLGSVWETRAWTVQEEFISRRLISMAETQVYFQCLSLGLLEASDNETEAGWSAVPGFENIVRLHGVELNNRDPQDWFVQGFIGILQNYTSRKLTHDSDSLNGFLGILSAWQNNFLTPSTPFIWGLPLHHCPQFLGWMHIRSAGLQPKRRPAFPSWSWAGWEGTVQIDYLLPEGIYTEEQCRRRGDLTVRVMEACQEERVLVVEGWVVELEIRTEPFSDAYLPGTDDVIGMVKERDFIHNNTLPSGLYTCLVVERVRVANQGATSEKERVFMMVLDWERENTGSYQFGYRVARRKTMITFFPSARGSFMRALPVKRTFCLV